MEKAVGFTTLFYLYNYMNYKELYFQQKKLNKFAWGQYYQIRNQLYSIQLEIYNKVKNIVMCPVCLCIIKKENLDTTPCGCNYCKLCLKELKENSTDKYVECLKCDKTIYCKNDLKLF